jgi:hypothetical protein
MNVSNVIKLLTIAHPRLFDYSPLYLMDYRRGISVLTQLPSMPAKNLKSLLKKVSRIGIGLTPNA